MHRHPRVTPSDPTALGREVQNATGSLNWVCDPAQLLVELSGSQ